jgi:plastocyanin
MRKAMLMLAAGLVFQTGCQESPMNPGELTDAPASFNAAPGIPANAVIRFGNADLGSAYDPPSGHDASYHAKDKAFPRTVVISAGGTVTFEMGVFHQAAIYADGVRPEDIDPSSTIDLTAPPPAPPGTIIIPDFIIDDANQRTALSPFSFAPMTWTSPPGTFDNPGRYLVICTVLPHFVQANMYAWVIVK